jgi:hypothetical protein
MLKWGIVRLQTSLKSVEILELGSAILSDARYIIRLIGRINALNKKILGRKYDGRLR